MELIEERILSEDVNCDTDDQFEVRAHLDSKINLKITTQIEY